MYYRQFQIVLVILTNDLIKLLQRVLKK